MVLWGIAGIALLVALVAFQKARRIGRKLDALTQSYWELRYDYTRLRSVVSRLDAGEPAEPSAPGTDEAAAAAPSSQVTFVPLSSMKKKNG